MKKFLLSSIFSLVLLVTLFGTSAFAAPAHAMVPSVGPTCSPRASISEPYPFTSLEYTGGGDCTSRADVFDAYADLYHYTGGYWFVEQEAHASCTSCYGIRADRIFFGAQDGNKYKVEGFYFASDPTGQSSNHTWTICIIFHLGAPLGFCSL